MREHYEGLSGASLMRVRVGTGEWEDNTCHGIIQFSAGKNAAYTARRL